VVPTTNFVPMDSAPTKWVHASDKCASVTASLPKLSNRPFLTIAWPMAKAMNTVSDRAAAVANHLTDGAARAIRITFSGTMPITTSAVRTDLSDPMAPVNEMQL